jgi:predicted RNA-binding Zn-ribbon protein involved in translation (DUF1610 family)
MNMDRFAQGIPDRGDCDEYTCPECGGMLWWQECEDGEAFMCLECGWEEEFC